jgi:hypothetical protein
MRDSESSSESPVLIRLEPLGRQHDRGAFDCGEPAVTRYLQTVALQAQEVMRAATRVAISPASPGRILGYFTLVAIKIVDSELPADLARRFKLRNLASGARAILLAQLGVDRGSACAGLGTFLLRQAMRQAVSGSLEVGGVALIVDALNARAAAWYTAIVPDFRPLTDDGLRLILPMRTLVAAMRPSPPLLPSAPECDMP